MRTTALDFSILGLLLSGPKTAYAIRMIFKSTAMGNYSSSPGSIYPAVRKLRKLGLVTQETEEGGLLDITDEGRHQLKAWLIKPFNTEVVAKETHILILKFAFMDHLVSHQDKVQFLELFEQHTKSYLKSLEAYAASEAAAQLPLHGRLSFEYGLASLKTQLSWIKTAYKAIEANS